VTGGFTLVGALTLGLLASGHCLLMCGGISGALAVVTRTREDGKPRVDLLLAYQAGRIGSYTLAGASLGAVGAGFLQLIGRSDVQQVLRVLSAVMIGAVAISLLRRGRGIDLGIGKRAWRRLAPLARRLLPVRNVGQAFAFGALWGWMPCGLVYSVLLVAWLTMDPLRSAAIMLMFGLGTAPAVLAGAFGARAGLRWLGDARVRSAAAAMLIVMAVATISAPWLVSHLGLHFMRWLPFDCAQN
jgi:sulfite exporter TauE/SafE